MSNPRAAVIGYGYAGRSFHSYLISLTPGLTLHVIASSDPAKREQIVRERHCKAYSSFDEVIADPAVDLVVLATPNDVHADLAPQIACPLQFHYAGHDDHIPPSAVDSVRQALAGHDAQVHVYADAQHGFNCWARATYHAPSAALSHGRATTFLAAHLF